MKIKTFKLNSMGVLKYTIMVNQKLQASVDMIFVPVLNVDFDKQVFLNITFILKVFPWDLLNKSDVKLEDLGQHGGSEWFSFAWI